MTFWERLAKEWRIQNPEIDKEKLEEDIGRHLDEITKTIKKSKTVPSAWDEIFGDDDDEEDW